MNSLIDKNNNKRALIYCRVSTIEQAEEGNSLITQERICKDYAIKHGFEVVHVFIEKGESAKTVDRKELKKLLTFCSDKRNKINAVIAYKLDRISRNTDDYSQLRLLLKRYSVEIRSTSEHFENSPVGRFMENTIANIAQFDNDIRTERSVNGMKEAMREGRYVWMAPLGYSNAKVNGKSTIIPNKYADFVKAAFKHVAQNKYPIEVIRRSLEKEFAHLNKPISKTHFYRLLKKPIYAGWIIMFGEKKKGLFETLISQEIFDRVQYVVSGRSMQKYTYMRENPDFPLRRFVHYPSGSKLTGSWSQGRSKKYAYYRYQKENIEFKKEQLEDLFSEYLNHFRFTNQHFAVLKKCLKKHLENGLANNNRSRSDVERAIVSLKSSIKVLCDKNEKGIISDSILKSRLQEIEHELSNASEELYKLPEIKVDIDELLHFVKSTLLNPSSAWEIASFETKLQLQRFYFPEGISFNGREFRTTKICCLFKDKFDKLTTFLPSVPLRFKTSNHQPSHSIQNKDKTQAVEKILNELIKLSDILKGKKEEEYDIEKEFSKINLDFLDEAA